MAILNSLKKNIENLIRKINIILKEYKIKKLITLTIY